MKDQNSSFPWDLPWETEDPETGTASSEENHGENDLAESEEHTLTIDEVSHLLDQMVMDIQHLELEVIRARYKLSSFLEPPYGEYLRMEIFSSMGSRYGGDPVYDRYLSHSGMKEYDDAIDTPFHLKRKWRLSKGFDDFPDYYP